MSRHFSTAEQISVLSDEQIDALLAEMEGSRETQVEPGGVKRIIGKGIIRGAAAFGEGALLGFQGRPLSEGTFTGDKPKAATGTYGELLKREQLKNIVDPSRIKAQQDIEENKRKEEVLQRKLKEQGAAPEAEAITPTEQTVDVGQPTAAQDGAMAKARPPKRIKIGEDQDGLAIYDANPDYADALKQEAEVRNFEQKKKEAVLKEQEPMTKDTASSYSGALQGLRDIKQIYEKLGLSPQGQIQDENRAKDLIYKANLSIEGAGATNQGKGLTQFIPGLVGAYKSSKVARGGDEGADLGNVFMTLAENQLRARTGAAAPEPEIVREFARSLLKSFIESPGTWANKLNQIEQFLLGTAQSIRPTKWQADLNQYSPGKSMQESGDTQGKDFSNLW